MRFRFWLVVCVVLTVIGVTTGEAGAQAAAPPAWTADLAQLRQVARLIPGPRPLRVNVWKFAESRRTKNFAVKGEPAQPSVQARTVFQVMYPDGYIMVDSGMDLQVHKTFGRGVEEPYSAEANELVQKALRGARLIVLTHEHGDHIAGVIRTTASSEIASRTILTRTQAQTLLTKPQMPEIALKEADLVRYRVIDYDKYMPLAPGIALVKAAGHTPGSQMVFVAPQDGPEILLIGDATWHMDGVRLMKGKDAPWVTEDPDAVMAQLTWLNGLLREPNLQIVASHDEEQHKELVAKKILGGTLEP